MAGKHVFVSRFLFIPRIFLFLQSINSIRVNFLEIFM